MAVQGFGSLVYWTSRLDACRAFYEALGLEFADEEHEEGPLHVACEVGDVHFAIYEGPPGEAPNKRQGGAALIGFKVDDVDAVFARLRSLTSEVLWEPQDAPWGRTAQLRDPDGRPVEIFQAG